MVLRIEKSTTASRVWLAERLVIKSAANVRPCIWLVKSGRRPLAEPPRNVERWME